MLREALERILNDWPKATTQQFTGHPLANFIRKDFPDIVSKIIGNNYADFYVTGSPGAGNWANVPWLSILNPKITSGTQDGIYPVYLFCADGSGVYLSLNQGTTKPKEKLGSVKADERAIKIRNEIYARLLETNTWGVKSISLRSNTSLGKSYELPNIVARLYKKNSLPPENELIADLLWMMEKNREIVAIWNDILVEKESKHPVQTIAPQTQAVIPKKNLSFIVNLPKPFLLLAGISGTGKTRFVREQAKASAGLHNMTEGENFCLVPVRPDWHEPSDLLGYISRIGNDGPRYVVTDLLQFIVATWKHAAVSASATNITYKQLDNICPFWLCLDEMNLAPVEQYFADYLSILETRKWEDGAYACGPLLKPAVIQQQLDDSGRVELWKKLNIAGDDPLSAQLREYFTATGIPLPPNLIVAGTVNMDETTHGFSRKVIDRALTIDFGEFFPNDYKHFFQPVNRPKALGFPVLSQITKDDLPAVTADPDGLKTIAFLEAINGILKETPFELAYRALNEALLAVVCFNPSDEIQLQAVWDDFLMMKVLPRIEGDAEKLSYDGETSLLTKLSDILKENLPDIWTVERPDLLSEKLGDGAAVMTFCRSKKKLEWMQNRLAANAFTTFWP